MPNANAGVTEFAMSPFDLDTNNQYLYRFAANGQQLSAGNVVSPFGSGSGGIMDLAYDSNGDLFLLMKDEGTSTAGIYRYDPLTNSTQLAVSTGVLEGADLAVAPNGGFAMSPFDLDTNNQYLYRFAANGQQLSAGNVVSPFGSGSGGIMDLAYDSNGDLFLLMKDEGTSTAGIYRYDPLTNSTQFVVSTGVLEGADLAIYPQVSETPEPSTFALTALGLLGLGFYGWRRKRMLAA